MLTQERGNGTGQDTEFGSTHHSASMSRPTPAKSSSACLINISPAINGTTSCSTGTQSSYSCMPNMEAVLRNKNTRVLYESKPADASVRTRSCRDARSCPLNGQCLKSCIVYKATVQKASGDISYLGVSERPFKERYNNHTKAFRNMQYEKDTELSKLI